MEERTIIVKTRLNMEGEHYLIQYVGKDNIAEFMKKNKTPVYEDNNEIVPPEVLKTRFDYPPDSE